MEPSALPPATDPHLPLLHGLRVVEFSAFVAAPTAGLSLAQLGAQVIRVDPPGGNIDRHRHPLNAQGESLYWASLNRGKRSVEIDLRQPGGQALMQQLIAAAPAGTPPVFITNLGVSGELAWPALQARCPGLIMVQLSGSPDGSNAVDYTVNSAAGFPLATGQPGQAPVNAVLPAWDIAAGLYIALAVVAAERHWQRTGAGQLITLALSDVAMSWAANLALTADVQVNGRERQPDGNQLFGAYGDSFPCADARHVMVVALTGRQWAALLAATGLGPHLPPGLDSDAARYAARAQISATLAPWFAQRPLHAVARALDAAGALWGPYRSFAQMLAEDPRCSPANPLFRTVRHGSVGEWLTARSPLFSSASANLEPAAGPLPGADTWAELRRAGCTPAQLAAAAQAGVIPAAEPPGADTKP